MSCVLITGASGFIGSAVVNRLAIHSHFTPRAAVRRDTNHFPSTVDVAQVGDLDLNTNWSAALRGVSTVIHTAARVHVLNDSSADPLREFRRVNVEGTLSLAQQAVSAGVTRFVFISSIKVNGESTPLNRPYTEKDAPRPIGPYAISKYETEEGLRRLAIETGLEVVIIRPPLVYGPGVKANFLRMMRWLKKGIPLPLGAIHNKRSLISLENLVDLIFVCTQHCAAANQTFLAGDGKDLSTTELLQRMGQALGGPVRLFPVPEKLLEVGSVLLGKREIAQRLCGSLRADITKARTLLGWDPPMSVDEGLRQTAERLLHEKIV